MGLSVKTLQLSIVINIIHSDCNFSIQGRCRWFYRSYYPPTSLRIKVVLNIKNISLDI